MKQIEPGLDRAVAATADFEKILAEYDLSSRGVDSFRREYCNYLDLFNLSTDILGDVTSLRKRYCDTIEGNRMRYTEPEVNEFENMIRSINILRCQFCDYMVAAKSNHAEAKKERDGLKKILRIMAEMKSEANTGKGANNGR